MTFLDREVGEGEWAMVLTADHASMPDPAVSGGFQISTGPMQEMINERFGAPGGPDIVELMQPTQAFLNLEELDANGHTVDDVARYMVTFTQAQTAGGGVVPNPGQENDAGDGRGVPVGADAGPAVPARGGGESVAGSVPASRSRSSILWRFPWPARGCGLRERHLQKGHPLDDSHRHRDRSGRRHVRHPTGRPGPAWLGSWWVIGGFTLLMLLALGWKFLADPSLSAPDPRPRLVHVARPGHHRRRPGAGRRGMGAQRPVRGWLPGHGAVRGRAAAAGGRHRPIHLQRLPDDRHPDPHGPRPRRGVVPQSSATRSWCSRRCSRRVALFLTTPYVGYLDNITVLFLLSLMIPFVHEARTSWGARTALFLIGIAAAFTHPTTCVIFGAVLMAVFGFHFLTSRFSLGAALRADGPMLMSVGFGMIAGLACWVVGIWGKPASLAEAALAASVHARSSSPHGSWSGRGRCSRS